MKEGGGAALAVVVREEEESVSRHRKAHPCGASVAHSCRPRLSFLLYLCLDTNL